MRGGFVLCNDCWADYGLWEGRILQLCCDRWRGLLSCRLHLHHARLLHTPSRRDCHADAMPNWLLPLPIDPQLWLLQDWHGLRAVCVLLNRPRDIDFPRDHHYYGRRQTRHDCYHFP